MFLHAKTSLCLLRFSRVCALLALQQWEFVAPHSLTTLWRVVGVGYPTARVRVTKTLLATHSLQRDTKRGKKYIKSKKTKNLRVTQILINKNTKIYFSSSTYSVRVFTIVSTCNTGTRQQQQLPVEGRREEVTIAEYLAQDYDTMR